MMSTLTITAKGQVTLRKDILRHLGAQPGQKVEVIELPGGRIELRAVRPAGSIDTFFGLLAGKATKVASIEEIGDAASNGWASKARSSLSIPTSWFAALLGMIRNRQPLPITFSRQPPSLL